MPCRVGDMDSISARFQPSVRIGNWVEENCLEEDKIVNFKKQRDRGELLVEKARTLYDNFHKEVVLAAPKQTIIFGAIVQLMPIYMNISDMDTSDLNAALSVVINEKVVRKSQSINEDCELTVAPSKRPCVRNSFKIVSGDGRDRTGENIKYGQRFQLQCMASEQDPIVLYSGPKRCNLQQGVNATYLSHKNGELNLNLGLVHRTKINCPDNDIPLAYTNWFCRHVDPKQRFESEGEDIPSNTPLVIVHGTTNRNLAAENVLIQTLFGPEFLVSVQNYRNIYKHEIWKNVWMISNGHQTGSKSSNSSSH
ncbi:cilia- and flagella-associated protein 161 [Drosophila subpulchrella]|uniref:cilia- and flagella-associated protein 161 n=1 Tax=Drosophila subpulchrella TaxID=1486046 RepID=UPI0018A19F19|nr:cilia- and flagella-associated protein 161 [Drosophila subpulchrella]